jgi:Ca2+:H+ antiporter
VAVTLLTVLAALARYDAAIPHLAAFIVAGLALAGGAWIVSFATEQVGQRFGTAATGLLQSTLGNLPEFFVVIFALNAGQKIIAQTAILGSILVNALFVMGLVIVVGALRERDGIMRFSSQLARDATTLLLVTSLIVLLVRLADSAHDPASAHVKAISIVGAVAILVVYGLWVRQQLTTQQATDEQQSRPRLSPAAALVLLIVAGVAAGFVSDWFVHALQPSIHSLGISQSFAGLIIVATAGNAVEHAVGVVLAARGYPELAMSVVKNSVAQVATFLFPVLVLVSLLTATTLTFALAPVYTGALLGTAALVWQVTNDGEASAFEGAALMAGFLILAVVSLFEA